MAREWIFITNAFIVCVPHRPLSTSGLVCFLHFPHGMIRVLIYPSTHERIFIMKKKWDKWCLSIPKISGQKANKCLNTRGHHIRKRHNLYPLTWSSLHVGETESPSSGSFILPCYTQQRNCFIPQQLPSLTHSTTLLSAGGSLRCQAIQGTWWSHVLEPETPQGGRASSSQGWCGHRFSYTHAFHSRGATYLPGHKSDPLQSAISHAGLCQLLKRELVL